MGQLLAIRMRRRRLTITSSISWSAGSRGGEPCRPSSADLAETHRYQLPNDVQAHTEPSRQHTQAGPRATSGVARLHQAERSLATVRRQGTAMPRTSMIRSGVERWAGVAPVAWAPLASDVPDTSRGQVQLIAAAHGRRGRAWRGDRVRGLIASLTPVWAWQGRSRSTPDRRSHDSPSASRWRLRRARREPAGVDAPLR